jgi:O-antigen/teichoic acid export membrane protein
MLLSRAASFFLLPVYTRYLTPADYGVLEIIDFTMFMLAAVIGVSIAGDALFYFHARLEDGVARRRAVQTVLMAAVGISVTGCVLIQLLATQLSVWFFRTEAYAPALRIAAAAFLFNPPSDAFLCYLRAVEKTAAFMTFSLLRLAGAITFNVVLLVVFKMGLYAMLVSNLAVSVLVFIGLAVYSMRLMKGWAGVDVQILKKVARYSMPIGVSSIAMLLVHYGDRFFLSRYCTLAEIGVYALAYKLGMALNYLNSPFQMFWRSQVYSIVDHGDGDRIFVRVFTYLEILFVSVAFALSLFAVPLVQLLSSPGFWGAAAFVPFLVSAYAFNALEYQMQSALLVAAKTRKIMISTLTGVAVCVTGYVLLIPRFGVWGAVLATCLAFSTMFGVTFFLAQRQRHLPFSYLKIAILPVLAVALVLLRSFIQPVDGVGGIAISMLVFAVLPAAILVMPIYAEERELTVKVGRKLASYVIG